MNRAGTAIFSGMLKIRKNRGFWKLSALKRWRSCQFYTANTAVSLMDRAGTAIFSGITGCRVLPELDVQMLNLHRADAAAAQIDDC